MANIFIIHGVGGYPKENWLPWLKQKLEPLGHKVFIPQFPTPENQTLENWLIVLDQFKIFINPETIFVGHSLGVAFILNILEQKKIKAAFLVAGFVGKTFEPLDESMKTFTQKSFDWNKIKHNCKNFYIFHSDNDPYVKFEKAEELAKNLDTKIIEVKNAGHFNAKAGYKTFDLLFEKIQKELQN